MKSLPPSLPFLILWDNLRSGKQGARALPHTFAQALGGGRISRGLCPRSRAGFPSLGETKMHLVEVGLHFSYSGSTEHECKSLLKC